MDILLCVLYLIFGVILFCSMYGGQKRLCDYGMENLSALVILSLFWPIAVICVIILVCFELW